MAEIDRGGGIAIGADVIGTIALSYDGCNGFCYLIMVIVMVMVVRVVVMITVAVILILIRILISRGIELMSKGKKGGKKQKQIQKQKQKHPKDSGKGSTSAKTAAAAAITMNLDLEELRQAAQNLKVQIQKARNVGGPVTTTFASSVNRKWLDNKDTPIAVAANYNEYVPQVGDIVLYYPCAHYEFVRKKHPDIIRCKKDRLALRRTLWERAVDEKKEQELKREREREREKGGVQQEEKIEGKQQQQLEGKQARQ